MSTIDKIELAIDTYLYLSFIFVIVRYNKDWDSVLSYKEDKEK